VRPQADSKRLKTWPIKTRAISNLRAGHICKAVVGDLRTSLANEKVQSSWNSVEKAGSLWTQTTRVTLKREKRLNTILGWSNHIQEFKELGKVLSSMRISSSLLSFSTNKINAAHEMQGGHKPIVQLDKGRFFYTKISRKCRINFSSEVLFSRKSS